MDNIEWIVMLEKMQDIRQFCGNHVKRAIKGGITSAQELDFLSRLELTKEKRTPQHLCAEMGVLKSVISRLTEHLEQKGFVEKTTSCQDKRSYELTITSTGREELRRTYAYYLEPVYRLKESLGEEDFEQLLSLIRRSNQLESERQEE